MNLVEKLGPIRKINVESEKGVGSIFSFLINIDCEYKADANNRKIKQTSGTKKYTNVLDHIIAAEDIPRISSNREALPSPAVRTVHADANSRFARIGNRDSGN